MELIFDKCLREYLDKRNKTQRELAEFLCISTQAVSKWCRGENLPDISLLPRIAAFLDVSVDELLGVGEIRKQEKIEEYNLKRLEHIGRRQYNENLELWQSAHREFPNDMMTLCCLSEALYLKEKYHEAVEAGERVLRESTDQRLRDAAIRILCLSYSRLGNREKAQEYVGRGSNILSTTLELKGLTVERDERRSNALLKLATYLDLTGIALTECVGTDKEQAIKLHEFFLNLLELYFDDGFMGSFAISAMYRHIWLSVLYAEKGDESKARGHFEAAELCAEQYDSLGESVSYTSTVMAGLEYDNLSKVIRGGMSGGEVLREWLQKEEFDSWRDRDWFISLAERLAD